MIPRKNPFREEQKEKKKKRIQGKKLYQM